MRYNLQETPKRKLSQVIVGAADDARWRGVEGDRIDSTRRHEIQQKDREIREGARNPAPMQEIST